MKRVVQMVLPLLIVFFIIQILIQYNSSVSAAAYKLGSKGDMVSKIETKLKSLGYFKGTPDNYFGSDTKEAVIKFQKARGLKVDGVVGSATLNALGISTSNNTASRGNKIQRSDVSLLGRIINGEGRGEPYIGQVAIGAVIVNRTRDPRFPKTIAGVIYQPGAFTAIADGQINAKLEPMPQKAANDALNGWDPSGGAIYYYNPAKTTNKWIWSRPIIKKIGKHVFCK
ncbi:Spore cortex-lytic enzyme precursor [Caloramator mitchellensis]|uniref:Spore cortex-lytic enzyme n=1 Tax=Caloramator mitchellensis TaxID=908809 RepID=A0A0R3JW28_CALMK|nr:spore cortex-lytic enzyme [Caloramator mitchellensis]KRQ87771.1 Spore cortex-lytic enzyme precursor [Caloramator mitchellensis]